MPPGTQEGRLRQVLQRTPSRLSAGLPLCPSAHPAKSAKGSAPHWLAVIDTAASKGPSMTIYTLDGTWNVDCPAVYSAECLQVVRLSLELVNIKQLLLPAGLMWGDFLQHIRGPIQLWSIRLTLGTRVPCLTRPGWGAAIGMCLPKTRKHQSGKMFAIEAKQIVLCFNQLFPGNFAPAVAGCMPHGIRFAEARIASLPHVPCHLGSFWPFLSSVPF